MLNNLSKISKSSSYTYTSIAPHPLDLANVPLTEGAVKAISTMVPVSQWQSLVALKSAWISHGETSSRKECMGIISPLEKWPETMIFQFRCQLSMTHLAHMPTDAVFSPLFMTATSVATMPLQPQVRLPLLERGYYFLCGQIIEAWKWLQFQALKPMFCPSKLRCILSHTYCLVNNKVCSSHIVQVADWPRPCGMHRHAIIYCKR